MSLYESSVRKPVMTALVFMGVVILGLFSLNRLPIDLLPKIETNTIMVMTTYDGASASDIETNVTRPLESSLNTVANLKSIRSSSKENRSIITLEFNYGNDIDVITNDIKPIILSDGQKWEQLVIFTPQRSGDRQKVEFSLYKEEAAPAYLSLRLWINVK